jgi:hypothetical protein
MSHGLRPKLRIPRLLAVSALGIAAGCGDDSTGDTGNDSGPETTATSAADSTTGAEDTDVTATGPADSTGDSTETDTGAALPDCQANADQASCEATMSCVYLPELGGCIIDCTIIEDEATCMSEQGCLWYGEFCDFEPIA